ncbi:glycine, alanine and asparagine-rich protein-like [Salvia splendens]|uniref:glycine, alanine and asparagine-rich protein-like n=1 Tax=Salvia splendens TaxID=180675 RepID=UPI001C25FBC0|nr:glycine, alanine and asparagine-rich protein-like [Salvia splendens]
MGLLSFGIPDTPVPTRLVGTEGVGGSSGGDGGGRSGGSGSSVGRGSGGSGSGFGSGGSSDAAAPEAGHKRGLAEVHNVGGVSSSRALPKFKAICAQEQAGAPGPKRTRHNIARDYNSSSGSGSQSFDLNDEQAEEPSVTHSRRARLPGQHASIRRARETGISSRRSSAAFGSPTPQPAPAPPHRVPGSREVLRENLDVQLMQQPQDVCSKYEAATDPFIKDIYLKLISRIQHRLGLADEAPGAGAAGGSEGDGEEEEDSGFATD